MGIKTGKPLETLAVFGVQSFRPHVLVGEDGFEPSKRNAADLQSVPFGHSGTPPNVQLSVPMNFDIIA